MPSYKLLLTYYVWRIVWRSWRPFLGHPAWSWTTLRRGNVFYYIYKRFFIFVTFLPFLTFFFNFDLNVFLHLCWRRGPSRTARISSDSAMWTMLCRDAGSAVAGRRRRRCRSRNPGGWYEHRPRRNTAGEIGCRPAAVPGAAAAAAALAAEAGRRRRHRGPRVGRPGPADPAEDTVVPRLALWVESGALGALQSMGTTQRSVRE